MKNPITSITTYKNVDIYFTFVKLKSPNLTSLGTQNIAIKISRLKSNTYKNVSILIAPKYHADKIHFINNQLNIGITQILNIYQSGLHYVCMQMT